MIGGFLGLLLGPQVLGKYTQFCLPFSANLAKWPGILITLVFSVQFLGSDPVDFNEAALSGFLMAAIGHMGQVVVGVLCAIFFIQYYPQIPMFFGLTPVFGFYGGHGTAAAAGQALGELGWADGMAVSNTMATAGLIAGIVVGMMIINVGVRKGYAKFALKPSDLPKEMREGYIPVEKRQPIGLGVTGNDVIDPFVFHLAIAGIICLSAYKVHDWLKFIPVPAFAWGLILGYFFWELFKKVKIGNYIDRKTVSRVSGLAMEYLICSAIATLNIGIFRSYPIPIFVTIFVVILANIILYMYFGSHIFRQDWFERTVGSFGQGSGVLATGLMLVRVLDPELKTTGAGCIAAASVLGYLVSMPFLAFSPALVQSMNRWVFLGLTFAIFMAFVIVARVFFWKKK